MSIIGPRPALWNQYDLLDERDKYGANDVMPGLTGWAQIHGRDELEIPVKAKLDGFYVKHMSFRMDAICFVRTIFSVLKSEGVVEGGTGEMSKKKDKVLIITNHSYMLYQFRKELIEKLIEKYGVVISMPFVGREDEFAKMGCRCIETEIDRRGINPVTDLKLIKTYWKMMRSEKPDLVITYSIKPNIYAAHCVVLPSYHEGMSNVLLEAAASGRPVITSDIPGCRESVDDGKTGYLCGAKDAESLYKKMKQFVKLDHEDKEKMGKDGRTKMENEFNKKMVVEETIKAL